MASLARSTVCRNERFLGDLGGLARENPDSHQFMHQTACAAVRPLVMMSFPEGETADHGGPSVIWRPFEDPKFAGGMEQIGGSAPKPPEFFALGQWASPRQDVPQQAQLPAAAPRQSPFGGARRSGCPPAEPYPADAGLRVATKRPPLQQNHRLTDEIQLCSGPDSGKLRA